ncbi:hypothetical protein BC628DRAFT_1182300 [Trametes gibbosa]|nr:hypothetical protein BC628DRAFT_1182300 [Trametes gibbosa]
MRAETREMCVGATYLTCSRLLQGAGRAVSVRSLLPRSDAARAPSRRPKRCKGAVTDGVGGASVWFRRSWDRRTSSNRRWRRRWTVCFARRRLGQCPREREVLPTTGDAGCRTPARGMHVVSCGQEARDVIDLDAICPSHEWASAKSASADAMSSWPIPATAVTG